MLILVYCLIVLSLSSAFLFNKEIKKLDKMKVLFVLAAVAGVKILDVNGLEKNIYIIPEKEGVFLLFTGLYSYLFCFSLLIIEFKSRNDIREYMFTKIIFRYIFLFSFYKFQILQTGGFKNITSLDKAFLLGLFLIFTFLSITKLYYFMKGVLFKIKGILFKSKTEETPAAT